jgi:phospholipase/carboxylesterase
MQEMHFGPLQVYLTGGVDREGGGDGPLVVLLHGYGANADDLLPLWRLLDVPRETRFAFIDAPLLLAGYVGGRAWWHLDIARLEAAMRGEPGPDRSAEVPEGLAEARAQVNRCLDEMKEKLRPRSLVLGGFSQGAMLSCDIALRSRRPLAGLILLSGTLLAAPEWRALAPTRRGLRVLQSHGLQDALLPHAAAERLRDLLREAELEVEWLSFRGGHEIPDRVMEAMGRFITTATSLASAPTPAPGH